MTTTETKSRPDFLEYSHTVGITTMDCRGFYVPVDTAIGKDGRLYVLNRSQVLFARSVRVTMCNAESEYFGNLGSYGEGDGQFVLPSGGAVDSQGRV